MIHVAFATDRDYLPWCATAIRSCLDNTSPTDLFLHVLHLGDLTGRDQGFLDEMVEQAGAHLDFHPIPASGVARLPAVGHPTAWLRFFLAERLPGVERVLYLDADTVVLKPLADLWSTDLGEFTVAAVASVVEPEMQGHVKSLGLSRPDRFLNSGVLFLDLDRMRRDGDTDRLVQAAAARDPATLIWPDQELLNIVYDGRWLPLHPRWNAQTSFWTERPWAEEVLGEEPVEQAVMAPAILHFDGPHISKPWHYLNRHPWRDHYFELLTRTPWVAAPLVGRTPVTMAIRLLPPSMRRRAFLRLVRPREEPRV